MEVGHGGRTRSRASQRRRATRLRVAGMDDEAMEPGIEPFRLAEGRQVAPGTEECLLGCVLCADRGREGSGRRGRSSGRRGSSPATRTRPRRPPPPGPRAACCSIGPTLARPAWPLHRVWSRRFAETFTPRAARRGMIRDDRTRRRGSARAAPTTARRLASGQDPRRRDVVRVVRQWRFRRFRPSSCPGRLRLADRRPRARRRHRVGADGPAPRDRRPRRRRIVRPQSGERLRIGRALDAGAAGIMVPRLETVAEVQETLPYLRFPPEGVRGIALATRGAGPRRGRPRRGGRAERLDRRRVPGRVAARRGERGGDRGPRRRRRAVRRSGRPVALDGHPGPLRRAGVRRGPADGERRHRAGRQGRRDPAAVSRTMCLATSISAIGSSGSVRT